MQYIARRVMSFGESAIRNNTMTQNKSTNETYNNTISLLERYAAGDTAVEEKIIELNFGLVNGIAHRFKGRGCDFEDLVQIGSIGPICIRRAA